MKVSELIEKLKSFPQDLEVMCIRSDGTPRFFDVIMTDYKSDGLLAEPDVVLIDPN
jgi:hypothetical protein